MGQSLNAAMDALITDRAQLMARLESAEEFDLVIIGGGATGLGVAVDASVRGLKVLLLEAQDFAKGTSSRSTKLVHGGIKSRGVIPGFFALLAGGRAILPFNS